MASTHTSQVRRIAFEDAHFQPTSSHLGTWREASDITFGRDGVPFFVGGPYDTEVTVIRTLTRSAGEGNFHFVAPGGITAA